MFRRYALRSTLALATLALLGACASAPASRTLADAIASDKDLSTFSQLVAQAGMTEALKTAAPHTVFAPSDAAFKAVPAKTLDSLKADKEQLKAVLSYHIVPGAFAAADIKSGNVKTLQGANVAVARAGTFVTVEDAMVEQADLRASNGVVHVVDRVLMPPKK